MDPNATLAEFRACMAEGDYDSAAALARNLDEWLSKGGFLPDDWTYKGMVEQYNG